MNEPRKIPDDLVMHSTRYGASERPQIDDRLTVGPYTATMNDRGSEAQKMVWRTRNPVIGGWTERCLTEKELAAIKESWLRAHGVTPVAGAVGVVQTDPQPATDQHTQPAARSRQEGGDHYKRLGVEPWDVIDTWPLEQRIGFFRGNALKYLMRMGSKDERVTEVRKARHYIDKLIEALEDGQE